MSDIQGERNFTCWIAEDGYDVSSRRDWRGWINWEVAEEYAEHAYNSLGMNEEGDDGGWHVVLYDHLRKKHSIFKIEMELHPTFSAVAYKKG